MTRKVDFLQVLRRFPVRKRRKARSLRSQNARYGSCAIMSVHRLQYFWQLSSLFSSLSYFSNIFQKFSDFSDHFHNLPIISTEGDRSEMFWNEIVFETHSTIRTTRVLSQPQPSIGVLRRPSRANPPPPAMDKFILFRKPLSPRPPPESSKSINIYTHEKIKKMVKIWKLRGIEDSGGGWGGGSVVTAGLNATFHLCRALSFVTPVETSIPRYLWKMHKIARMQAQTRRDHGHAE